MYRQYSSVRGSKKKKKRLNIKLLIIIVGAAAIAAAVLLIVLLSPKTSQSEAGTTELAFLPTDSYAVTEDGLGYISGSKCDLLTADFSPVWENTLYTDGMKLSASESLCCAYTGTTLQTIDATGKILYLKNAASDVISACPGTERVAVYCRVTDDTGITSPVIYVIGPDGNDIAQIDFNSQSVIDYGFYGANEFLWVLTLDTSGSVPVSNITTYNPGKTMTGTMTMSQLVEKVVVGVDNIFAFGTTTLKTYTLFSEALDSTLVYGWRYVNHAFIKDVPTFVCAPRNADGSRSFSSLKLMSAGSAVAVSLPERCRDAQIYDGKLYAVSEKNVFTYSLNGEYQKTTAFPYSYDSVLACENGTVLLQKGAQVFAYRLS